MAHVHAQVDHCDMIEVVPRAHSCMKGHDIVHDPISASNSADVDVFSVVFEFVLPDPPEVLDKFNHGPSLNLEVSRVTLRNSPWDEATSRST